MTQIIRRAKKRFLATPEDRKIEMMAEIGLLTPEQAAHARRHLLDMAEPTQAKVEPSPANSALTADGV